MPNTTSFPLDRIPADTDHGVDGSIPHGPVGVIGETGSPLAITARLARLDVSGLDDEAALIAAVDCEKLIAFAHAIQLRALARVRRPREGCEEFVPDEVAPALAWTRNTAAGRVALAVDLTERIPAAFTDRTHLHHPAPHPQPTCGGALTSARVRHHYRRTMFTGRSCSEYP